jgi:hypothetical protein
MVTRAFGNHCPDDCFYTREMQHRDKRALATLGDIVTVLAPGKKHGTRLLGTWDEVEEKDDGYGSKAVRYREIIFCYLTCDYPNMTCEMRIQRKGIEYTVRGDPQDMGDGWHCLTLKKCGSC